VSLKPQVLFSKWGLLGLVVIGGAIGGYVIDRESRTVASAPQWSVYEIPLAASGHYSNPYTQASVSATIVGPGTTMTVKGFWDGGQTWRIRVACTAQGTWGYTTDSADSGLNGKSGIFHCVSPLAGNHGFLRRDVAYPSSFVWDDGSHYFMWGQTYYEIIRSAMAGTNWKTSIDHTAAYGMNKVRMLVYPWGDPSVFNPYPDSQPFMGRSTAPNHDLLNLTHWQRLDEIIQYLASKDLVADLIIFPDASRAFGTQAQDDRYTRYVIARFAAYHNVIWCLANEWSFSPKGQPYWDHEGSIVRSDDPWMVSAVGLRPLSIHQASDLTFNFPPPTHSWPTHAIIQLHGHYTPRLGGLASSIDIPDLWGNEGITANLGLSMPVVNDEYGYIGSTVTISKSTLRLTRDDQRHIIWGIATGGGYGSAGDATPLANNDFPWLTSDWEDEPEYSDIQRLVSFFTTQRIQYWKMTSSNELTPDKRVYVLGQARKEYVVYSAVGGKITLDLPPPNGATYRVTWYNPATGAYTGVASVAGGTTTFTPTFRGDTVLHLRSE
jgi:hypothetical protein